MGDYEKLTQFIPWLQEDEIGGWVFDEENDGTPEHPKRAPYVRYSKTVNRFVDAVIDMARGFAAEDGTFFPYDELKKAGLTELPVTFNDVDVSRLGGKTVVAMINAVIAGERFSDGEVGGFIKNGCIIRWLERLKEIDEQKPDLTEEFMNRIIPAAELSEKLTREVASFLEDWRPKNEEELTDLHLGRRFSVDHRAVYDIDVNGVQKLLHSCSDEEYDRFIASARAIQTVVDHMHTVCTMRDDVVDMICAENGIVNSRSIYSALEALAVQNDNLDFLRRRLDDSADA